jgi:rRNA-processing protein FCF1
MLLIDAANVVGSRPNGWWRDRPRAAREFVERVRAAVGAAALAEPVVVVLEGAARDGMEAGVAEGVTVLHASGSGDDTLLAAIADSESQVTLVSADRALCRRAQDLGAEVVRPGWLIDLLDQ